MSHPTPSQPAAFDELHPHGTDTHSGHVIVGPMQLRLVLVVLLVFTALTVATAQLELWVMNYFDIVLPGWLNVVGAMTIATIKSLLVMAIFMQLRYDNPVNTIAMAFTFAALGVFIIFTGMDLFSRSNVYDFKDGQIIAGGMGVQSAGVPTVAVARERELARIRTRLAAEHPELKDAALEEAVAAAFAQRAAIFAHGHAAHHEPEMSSPNRSRPRHGLTPAADAHDVHDGHGH